MYPIETLVYGIIKGQRGGLQWNKRGQYPFSSYDTNNNRLLITNFLAKKGY